MSDARKNRERWVVLGISYLLMVLFGFSLQALPPLLNAVRSDIPFSHTLSALLMASYALPGLIIPVAAGSLARRFCAKKIVLAALAAICGGTAVVAAADSFGLLLAGRLLAGTGSIMTLVFAPLFVNAVFDRRHMGKIIGFFNTGVPLGLVLAVTLFSRTVDATGWRGSFLVLFCVALAVTAVFAVWFRAPQVHAPSGRRAPSRGLMATGVLTLAAVNLLFNLSSTPFGSFGPEYFRSIGVDAAHGSTLLSVMMIETALLGPLAGYLLDRTGLHRFFLVMAALMITAALTMVALSTPGTLLAGALLLGGASAVVPVAVFPLLTEILEAPQVGSGLGVLVTASNVGTNLGLGLFGVILDYFGGFSTAFTILAGISFLIVPLIARFRRACDDEVPGMAVAAAD
ncbi:MAG TPA: MFS transporter [Verrucomicrobiae bacterium]|nr:MFS transporter [Verrucomicrobiae bacterium]